MAPRNAYPARAVLYNGKDVDLRSVEQVGGEEVQRQDPPRLGPQEFGPARSLPAGRGIDAGVLEDLPDRGRRHGDAEPGQLAVDAAVPHDSFSRASRSTTDRTFRCVAGRPVRPWRDRRDHRRRTMSRCHRKMVPGVTISRVAARRSIGSVPASRASNARSGQVKRE